MQLECRGKHSPQHTDVEHIACINSCHYILCCIFTTQIRQHQSLMYRCTPFTVEYLVIGSSKFTFSSYADWSIPWSSKRCVKSSRRNSIFFCQTTGPCYENLKSWSCCRKLCGFQPSYLHVHPLGSCSGHIMTATHLCMTTEISRRCEAGDTSRQGAARCRQWQDS